jgi:hypothetical protein
MLEMGLKIGLMISIILLFFTILGYDSGSGKFGIPFSKLGGKKIKLIK